LPAQTASAAHDPAPAPRGSGWYPGKAGGAGCTPAPAERGEHAPWPPLLLQAQLAQRPGVIRPVLPYLDPEIQVQPSSEQTIERQPRRSSHPLQALPLRADDD